ncbi:3'(2'),5'-bisphosphate nucleotidase CysQ [Magnetospirillum molischianum]|uniref:3'(2'),5'-bisphosphate nucleotidase CysQ n=1 Tax=Magnetospirillum molischianum DSM 120 TaxID=1150626 RepID=H8FNT9_MAGML|nr:3'(2'),5'-bisphosphate nucleotidase CysQ [Magnetospirillum molischianum]CCG40027.1 3'(2'),5'-bisphosphate nucleotidase CysQ [Magnetospirillum molischianum DSM 120]
MTNSHADLLPALEDLARRAGAAIMDIYAEDFAVRHKADSSPVTEADLRAEAIILPGLAALTPDFVIVAEEQVAAGRVPVLNDRPFWLVDPLDGTKEFVRRNGEFTVNIGLIDNGVPVAGVVLAPALGVLWSGAAGHAFRVEADGHRHQIACRPRPARGARIVTSRSHNQPEMLTRWMAPFEDAVLDFAGSSLKLCRVAEGSADLYPRFGPTCEWDIAAAHAVLRAAGGVIETFDGVPLAYAKLGFLNPDFVARGSEPIPHRV